MACCNGNNNSSNGGSSTDNPSSSQGIYSNGKMNLCGSCLLFWILIALVAFGVLSKKK